MACVQHEFGIYGGDAGMHLIELLRNLRKPVVTTLHTVLPNPPPATSAVSLALAKWSTALVTMTEYGRKVLVDRTTSTRPRWR